MIIVARCILPLLFCFLLNSPLTYAQKTTKTAIILDADTGNEVDDYYALIRALIEPTWDIICINATQWEPSQWAIPHTMENSHRLNQTLLGEMGLSIKTNRGGTDRMFDWGDKAQHSAAAYEIIKQAHAAPDGTKLTVIALGALTNIASAIYIDPSISSRIKLYWLGSTYDFDNEIFKRQDFNCMMDQQAVEMLLMSEAEMHEMPINVAVPMELDYDDTALRLPQNKVGRLLLDRWFDHLDAGRQSRIIWDLALIQSIIYPEWAETTTITTSRDHGARQIHYYSDIKADEMRDDFFHQLKEYFD